MKISGAGDIKSDKIYIYFLISVFSVQCHFDALMSSRVDMILILEQRVCCNYSK